ncbi:MAG: DUF3098 domain-containing protein [Candidatus Neomarinimicrobiota bacterium]
MVKADTNRNFHAAMKTEKQDKKLMFFESWTFTKINYVIFGIALLFIILGYVVMASGSVNSSQSLTVAPILLFIGYLILIPVALMYRQEQPTK